MEEVGIKLELTEEVEDSEEFVILDNENKDLHKMSEEQKEMKKILIEKAEEQSEKDYTVIGKINDSELGISTGAVHLVSSRDSKDNDSNQSTTLAFHPLSFHKFLNPNR
jgi:hypothetical protein